MSLRICFHQSSFLLSAVYFVITQQTWLQESGDLSSNASLSEAFPQGNTHDFLYLVILNKIDMY